MYRLLLGLCLLLVGLWCLERAPAQTLMTLGAGSASPVLNALDPATTAWVNAVVTAGGTVSATQRGFVNTLIKCYKNTSSTWTIKDREWLLASENVQQAAIDIVSLQTQTPTNSPTFSANAGYTGNGSSSFLDTGFTPSLTAGRNFVLNSATMGAYVLTSSASAGLNDPMAVLDSTATNLDEILLDPGVGAFIAINGSTSEDSAATANSRGSWFVSRTGASAGEVYLNGSNFTAVTQASTALPDGHMYVLARNRQGNTPDRYVTYQIADVELGGGMNGTQAAANETCKNAYMTSLGINVH